MTGPAKNSQNVLAVHSSPLPLVSSAAKFLCGRPLRANSESADLNTLIPQPSTADGIRNWPCRMACSSVLRIKRPDRAKRTPALVDSRQDQNASEICFAQGLPRGLVPACSSQIQSCHKRVRSNLLTPANFAGTARSPSSIPNSSQRSNS